MTYTKKPDANPHASALGSIKTAKKAAASALNGLKGGGAGRPRKRCAWQQDDEGTWSASCGLVWQMSNDSTLSENRMVHCPACGHMIQAAYYAESHR